MVMENEVVVEDVKETEIIEEVVEVPEEEEVVETEETQKILTEEEIRQQHVPELNYESLQVNAIAQKDIDRFWEKIAFPNDLVNDCWEWQAAKNKKGYGQFGFAGSMCGAHRFSYMIFKGAIKEGLCIRHKHDNPSCVNPHHLLVGTRQDNSDDKIRRNRQAKGEDIWSAKLTEIEADEILIQLLQKVPVKSLAIQHNISKSIIYNISTGRIWKQSFDKLSVIQKQQLEDNRKREYEGEDNGNSKLTENEVDEILGQLLQKVPVKSLAIQYNVHSDSIYNISTGKDT